MSPRVWENPDLNRPELPVRFFGFTEEDLHEVLRRAYREADFTTDNHPISWAGLAIWGEGHAALREKGILLGGTRCDEDGIPKVVSPDGMIALTVVSGDLNTGSSFRTPRTKRPRKSAGMALVRVNSQLNLFGGLGPEITDPTPSDRKTWYLLHHRHGDVVFCEVSLPDTMDQYGYVVGWAERILISRLDLGYTPSSHVDAPETPVIVPVTRRG